MAGSKTVVFLFAAVLIFSRPSFAGEKSGSDSDDQLLGGGCAYEQYLGQCRIEVVRKTKASITQGEFLGGAGYQGYEVRFNFIPQKGTTVPEDGNFRLGVSQSLRLENSWYPGPEFLKKYKITPGAVFDCTLNLISSGACSPVNFIFDAIDTTDYFESKEGK